MEHTAQYYKYVKYKTKYLELKQELDEMHGSGSTKKQDISDISKLHMIDANSFFNSRVVGESADNIIQLFQQYHQNLTTLNTNLEKCLEQLANKPILEPLNRYIVQMKEHITNFNKQKLIATISNRYVTINVITRAYAYHLRLLQLLAREYLHLLEKIPKENMKAYGCAHESFINDYDALVNNMIDIHNYFYKIVNTKSIMNFAGGEQAIKKLIHDVAAIHNILRRTSITLLHPLAGSNPTLSAAKSAKPAKRSCIIL